MNTMKERNLLKKEEGFTLVEVIAVLIILGILAAVAVPKYINLEEDAKKRAIDAAISEINGRESMTWAQVKISQTPVKATGKPPTDDTEMDTVVIATINATATATTPAGPGYTLNLTGSTNYTWGTDPPAPTPGIEGTVYPETLQFQGSKLYNVQRTSATMNTPAIWTRTTP